jgi:hypothetical protein
MRTRLARVALMLACCAAGMACAARNASTQGYRFQIVTGDDSSVTRRIADDLYKRLVPTFAGFRTELAQRRRLVLVAVGPAALRDAALRPCDCVVIAAFTSSQVWRDVMAQVTPARAASMTAIYAEPAPADQLKLIALLYHRPARVAAIVADPRFFAAPLAGAADLYAFTEGDDINRLLNRIAQTEVLLALPDNAVFNAENIRNILLSTYRHKQAVIGFSSDMVRAGALASTYSDIDDINVQVAETVAQFVASGDLPAPQFPRYFRTVVNEGVARSLDVTVDRAAREFARRPPASSSSP